MSFNDIYFCKKYLHQYFTVKSIISNNEKQTLILQSYVLFLKLFFANFKFVTFENNEKDR